MTGNGGRMIYPKTKTKVLFSRTQIEERVKALARQISEDANGRELVLIGVLNGAFIFLADLARAMESVVTVDFVRLASYGSEMTTSGNVKITKDLEVDISGKHVIIVEDIFDTGRSVKFLQDHIQKRNPASLKLCVLLWKHEREKFSIRPHYVGFEFKKGFILGYGLDYFQQYRNLPDILVLEET